MTHVRAAAATVAIPVVMLVSAAPLHAQTPERSGSFLVTALAGAAGSAASVVIASTFAESGQSYCPAVPGAHCDSSGGGIALVAGTSLVGTAAGAVVGRALMGGRQSFVRSLFGAALGTLVGAAVASQLGTTEPVPVVLSLVVPQGVFAALVGR